MSKTTAVVPFTSTGDLPSTIVNRQRLIDVNKDIVTTAPFPSLSIKGKVFTLVQDNERKVLTKPDDPDEVLQSVNAAVLRINIHAKTYYAKRYSEDESEGARPDCYSFDGQVPSPHAPNKQSEKCAVCPHNQWGSRISDDNTGKGKACADNARVAIADANHLDKPMLLRVPPASLRPLKDALKMVKQRGLQYNEVIYKIGFDKEAPSPKLTFKPVGVLGDAEYSKACEMFEGEIVRAIVGADEDASHAVAALPAPDAEDTDELNAALVARDATRKAATAKPAAPEKAPAKPKAEAKPAVKPAAKPAADEGDTMLTELDGLLGNLDD